LTILETKAETIAVYSWPARQFVRDLCEERTWAAWLHDLLQPHVSPSVDQKKLATKSTSIGSIREISTHMPALPIANRVPTTAW
jgi:hypothetical protein